MFPPREPRPEHGTAARLAALVAAAVALPLGACGRDEPDLSKGKALFTQKCGSCHTLARAGTQGQTGPNLDTAFRAALARASVATRSRGSSTGRSSIRAATA